MSINGDEGEPGTFKDRVYLERDPHRTLEGALIAAHAVEAERIYFYMRDEYPAVLDILRTEIAALEAAGIIAPGFIELRRGAGAYICGEESAMLESIEGKRGLPRHRPPYIAEVGLFGRPTLNHNVETLWWVRDIVEKGADWFAAMGKPGHPGIRSWSVSGRVKEPGRQAGAGRRHGARADRGLLRRHGRRPRIQGLSARRRLGRHPAGLDGRHPARFRRRACQAGRLRRLACGRGVLRQADSAKDVDAQPAEVLQARELRPVHAVPRGNRTRWSRCWRSRAPLDEAGDPRSGDASCAIPRSAGWARPRPTRSTTC